jgi:hypothetical protein
MNRIPSNLGLLIGIPTLGRLQPLQWGLAFKSLNCPINYNANTMVIYGHPVDEARNVIAKEALRQNAKFLFFLGDDVVVPAHALKSLIYHMEQHPEIGVVGGVYCSKCIPSAPLVFRELGTGSYWDWKVGEFFEVAGLGMDCTLIRTELFTKVSEPWFKTIDSDKFLDAINHADTWTEDLYFLKKVAEETNYKIYCDGSVICDHYDGNTPYKLPIDSIPMGRMPVAKTKRALDIGCGEINREEQFPEHTLVRVDAREECKPDYRCDIRSLPFGNEEFDLVFASHVLEHIRRDEWTDVLKEWIRVLKKDGEFVIIVPNLKWAAERLVENPRLEGQELVDVLNVIYGAQGNLFDNHYNGFWPSNLTDELICDGLEVKEPEFKGYNLILKSRKI